MNDRLLRCCVIPAALLALLGSGCSSVTIKQPLSATPEAIDKDRFEGTWTLEDGAIHIKFSDDGVGQIAGVQWKDGKFQLDRAEMIVTKGRECNYLSIRVEEDGKWADEYVFAQYAFTDQSDLVIWMPNVEAFAAAVKDNKLAGTIKEEKYSKKVTIASPPEDLLKFFQDPANTWLFEYKTPLVLRKLGGAKSEAAESEK